MLDHPTRFNPSSIGNGFLQYYAPHNVYHPGIDYNWGPTSNSDLGQPVWAPTYGEIIFISERGTNGGLGQYVVVYHPDFGVWTRYLHLDSVHPEMYPGRKLYKKQEFAALGNSGTSSAHLHFEVLNKTGLNWIKNHFRPFGRYPSGLSKNVVASMWIDPELFIQQNDHVPHVPPPFPDVDSDRWSAEAISFVKEKGLMKGYEDGTFKPERPVSREELAVILQRLSS